MGLQHWITLGLQRVLWVGVFLYLKLVRSNYLSIPDYQRIVPDEVMVSEWVCQNYPLEYVGYIQEI